MQLALETEVASRFLMVISFLGATWSSSVYVYLLIRPWTRDYTELRNTNCMIATLPAFVR